MSTREDGAEEPMIARDATYHRAPAELRARVHASLAAEARASRVPALWRALSFGVAFAAVALVSWNLALFQARPSPRDLLARDVVTAHVRSLMAGHLNDVVSSDQHTVKPWFTGKLDFSPPVHDLAAAGFTLTGGRLDYVGGRAVAALTYRYRLHVINVFVWPEPATPDAAPSIKARQGYSLVRWTHRGMTFCAVSDAEAAQLTALAEALERADAG
jgi:anti-sigma factor RsiW